jgi:hypothetical protein
MEPADLLPAVNQVILVTLRLIFNQPSKGSGPASKAVSEFQFKLWNWKSRERFAALLEEIQS